MKKYIVAHLDRLAVQLERAFPKRNLSHRVLLLPLQTRPLPLLLPLLLRCIPHRPRRTHLHPPPHHLPPRHRRRLTR